MISARHIGTDAAGDLSSLVPADKAIPEAWWATLDRRGEERVLTGAELDWLGLPVGGITSGQVYLGGDGRLWHWDVDNRVDAYNDNGAHYVDPWPVASPFQTGVALRTTTPDGVASRWLDGRGFAQVSFRSRYPLGLVELSDPGLPVAVALTAYSPFVAMDADRSSYPVTVLEYELRAATLPVDVELALFSENPVAQDTRQARAVDLTAAVLDHGRLSGVQFGVAARSSDGGSPDLSTATDVGTFAIAVERTVGATTFVSPAIGAWASPDDVLDGTAPTATAQSASPPTAGVTGLRLHLEPGETRTVRVFYGWCYPRARALDFLSTSTQRWYGRFGDAAGAVAAVHADIADLSERTRRWASTWYEESTLPWWLLERVGTGIATLATSTCYRLEDGRFYGWEGAYCCRGTCQHVWQYAHTMARVFPGLERDTRERVDLGVGFHAATGEMGNRAEADERWSVDGQAGTILRIYREHQMSTDARWLSSVWPRVRQAMEWMIQHDEQPDGVMDGAQENTLDTAWFGRIPWISGLYVAALRAAEAMAAIVGDDAFGRRCGELAASGTTIIERDLFNGDWFVHEPDPAHPGTVNTNDGVYVDQVFGQSWAHQLGLPRVFSAETSRAALESLWRWNFTPRPMDYRSQSPVPDGRIYYDDDTHALLMCTWPRGGAETIGSSWSVGYLNEAMNGFEYQVAAHMIAEGMVEKGLLLTRAVHERYRPERRNPYNEIECGDHYARSMASFGVYLAVLGYECDGPAEHLGFAPAIQQDEFAAAFTAAGGWGRYSQQRADGRHRSVVEIRDGSVRLRTLRLDVPDHLMTIDARQGTRPIPTEARRDDGGRLLLTFSTPVRLVAGEELVITAT